MRAQKRQGFGWERWSTQWLHDTLGLFDNDRVRNDLRTAGTVTTVVHEGRIFTAEYRLISYRFLPPA